MNPVEPCIGSRLRILGILSGCMILVESRPSINHKRSASVQEGGYWSCKWSGSPYKRGRVGSTCLYVYCSILKRMNKRSKVHRRFEDARPEGRGWEVVRPVHQVLPLQGPIILKRRVWSWLRRNASYMLNTCKSNVVFGELGRRKRGS